MNFGRRFNIPKFNFRNRTSAPFSNWRRSGYDLIYEKKNLDFDFDLRFTHFAYAYAGIATANFLYLTRKDTLDPSPKTGMRKTHGRFGIVQLNTSFSHGLHANIIDSVMFPFVWLGMMHEVEEPKQKPKREIKQEPEQETKQEQNQEPNKN